jgi:hypothetical protein
MNIIDKIRSNIPGEQRSQALSTPQPTTTDSKLADLLSNPSMLDKLKALLKKDLGIDVKEQKANRSATLRAAATKLHKPYLNKVTVTCSLCNTTTTHSLVMAWSVEQKCFTASYGVLGDAPPMPVHILKLITDNCSSCFGILAYWPKEYLIELLINRIKRDNLYLEKYHESVTTKGGEKLVQGN